MDARTETDPLTFLQRDKDNIALALSVPPARCIQRLDTDAPVFHGCIDWHSAVHGTWSLVAYEAMTRDTRYHQIVEKLLDPAQLKLEADYLAKHPDFEMPYGRAWFLRLAIEYERKNKDGRLIAMGDAVAASLDQYLREHPFDPITPTYSNQSWAMINLIQYYEFRHQTIPLDEIRSSLHSQLVAKTWSCNPEQELPGFMSMCYNLGWLASLVFTPTEFAHWVSSYEPALHLATPLHAYTTAHTYGLNFSRSWGLWAIYEATADRRYAEAFAAHFMAGYEQSTNWDGEYRINGHWVAQFGMLAIQPLLRVH